MPAKRRLALLTLVIAVLAAAGCASGGRVSPAVDLRSFGIIGLVELDGEAGTERAARVTRRLLESLHGAQPGVRILELGDAEGVLRAVDRPGWGPDTIRAIGRRFDVDAVLSGRLELSDLKPGGSIDRSLTSVSVRADVEGSLTLRLYETKRGATVWSASARHEEPVAFVGLSSDAPVDVDASSPGEAYERLSDVLLRAVTTDFRPGSVRR